MPIDQMPGSSLPLEIHVQESIRKAYQSFYDKQDETKIANKSDKD